jgi:hypothetical protein
VIPRSAVGDKLLLLLSNKPEFPALYGLLNSLVFDYIARQKVAGIALKYFTLKQLPVLRPDQLRQRCEWIVTPDSNTTHLTFLLPRLVELSYTACELERFAEELGYAGPPFVWNEDRRFAIRCELDAAFFHLYLPANTDGRWKPAADETPEQLAALVKHFPTPRDAVVYVMDQFLLVRKKDEAAHGRYRTKEQILHVYDAMQTARRTGKPYVSPLNPPPGDPRAAHAG